MANKYLFLFTKVEILEGNRGDILSFGQCLLCSCLVNLKKF